jgi:hypothetical protein
VGSFALYEQKLGSFLRLYLVLIYILVRIQLLVVRIQLLVERRKEPAPLGSQRVEYEAGWWENSVPIRPPVLAARG